MIWDMGYGDMGTWVIQGSTYTKNNDEEKVQVGDIVELEPQIFRDEAQRGVFGSSDLVSAKSLLVVSLFRLCLIWQRHIHVDDSGFFIHWHRSVIGQVGICFRIPLFLFNGRGRNFRRPIQD